MSDNFNNEVLPGDIQITDKRRFRVIPLRRENIDRAGIGEVVIDRENGDVYVINDNGEAICRTADLEKIIVDNMVSDINSLFYMTNRNRRVYRLFFNDGMVRLDTNLSLDKNCAYYRIRSLSDVPSPVYYVSGLTKINEDAVLENTMEEGQMYFVELYASGSSTSLISMLPFSAKQALLFENPDPKTSIITSLRIETNKDHMYVGDDKEELMIRVYGTYDDGSETDISAFNNITIDENIDTSASGNYKIQTTYIDTENEFNTLTTELIFEVKDNIYNEVVDMVVFARKVLNFNSGNSTIIGLQVQVTYADGTKDDITDKCVITGFDNELFNEEQSITVSFVSGNNDIQESYTIMIKDSGISSNYIVEFTSDYLITLRENRDSYPANAVYYRVRNAYNMEIYYNELTILHSSTVFYETTTDPLVTGTNVIVEFYNNDRNLIDSDVYGTELVTVIN